MKRLVCLSIVGLLAACGSSSSGSSRSDLVDGLASGLQNSSLKVTAGEAKCMASDIVDVVGVSTLQEMEKDNPSGKKAILTELGNKLSPAQVTQVINAITGGKCVNLAAILAAGQAKTAPFDKMTSTQATCFFQHILSDPAVKNAMGQALVGKPGDSSALSRSFSDPTKIQGIFGDCNIDIHSLQ